MVKNKTYYVVGNTPTKNGTFASYLDVDGLMVNDYDDPKVLKFARKSEAMYYRKISKADGVLRVTITTKLKCIQ